MSSTVSTYERNDSAILGSQGARASESRSGASKALFELSLSQLVILWSLMAGLLIMCFLFGFYAGREQGLRVAFEQYSGQAARIPIADPVASENSVRGLLEAPQPQSEVADGTEGADEEQSFDFSEAGKVSTGSLKEEMQSAKAAATQVAPQAAPQPAAAAPEKPSNTSPSSLQSGWYIQVAASKSQENADKIAAKMQQNGYATAVESAEVGGRQYYRVLIGAYSSRALAEQDRQALSKKKLSNAVPFLKRVS